MSDPRPASPAELFRGLWALCLEKRRALVIMPLWLALPLGFAGSFLARINHAQPADLTVILLAALCVCAGFAPLAGASFISISGGSQVGARSRRDELLSLPIGRLAIPSATLLVSLTLAITTYAAFVTGFSFFVGHEKVLEALTAPAGDHDMIFSPLQRLGGATAIFSGMWMIATIAHLANLSVLILAMICALLTFLPAISGYDAPAATLYAELCLGSLTALWLVLPFVLYARSPHHWVSLRGSSGNPLFAVLDPCSPLLGGGVFALGVFGWMGFGKGVVAMLLLGVLAAVRVRRRMPPAERRHLSHASIAYALGFVFVAPVVIFGILADAEHYADAARPGPGRLATFAVSPDGRYVAGCFQPDAQSGLSRVLVADVTGKEPLRVLPPRFAFLEEACAWSKDGRYLAVDETAVGRVGKASTYRWNETYSYGASVVGLDQFIERRGEMWMRSLQGTWILDTQTGSLFEREVLALAPGWSSPEELLHLTARALDGCDLTDGRGHESYLETPAFEVDGYSSAGAELISQGQRVLVGASGISPVSSASRWSLTSKDYPEPGVPVLKAGHRWDLTFSRGDKSWTVVGCHAPSPLWADAQTVFLHEGEGLVRHDLETGERLLMKTNDRKSESYRYWRSSDYPGIRLVGERPYFVVKEPSGTYSAIDLKTAATTPLPSFPGFVPAVVVGTRVFGRLADKSLVVSEDGAAPHPVF